jgi:hypothetical protein
MKLRIVSRVFGIEFRRFGSVDPKKDGMQLDRRSLVFAGQVIEG